MNINNDDTIAGGSTRPFFVEMIADNSINIMSKQQNDSGNIEIIFDGLTPGKTYTGVKLQLYQIDGSTKISSEFTGMDPNSFSTTEEASPKVTEITNPEIDTATITETTVSISMTVNDDSSTNGNVQDYFVQMSGKDNGTSFTKDSTKLSDSGEVTVEFTELIAGHDYTEITVQLLDSDETTTLGSQVGTNPDNFKTKDSGVITDVTGIESASIDVASITKEGFTINSKVTQDGEGEVNPYKLKIFANDNLETEIWTSEELTNAGEITSTVDKLKEGTEYTNVKIGAYGGDGFDTLFGEELTDVTDSITTLDKIDSIENGAIDENSITSDGFTFTIDIVSLNGKDKVTPYSVEAVSVDEASNEETLIWTSDETQKAGTGFVFTVDGLNPQTEYKDIHFKIKSEKVEIPGLDFDTEIDITTTEEIKSSGLQGWEIALIVIGSLLIVGAIAGAVYYFIFKDKKQTNPKIKNKSKK